MDPILDPMPPLPIRKHNRIRFSARFDATKAFDDGGNASASRWLAKGNRLPSVWISRDFSQPTKIFEYTYSLKVGGLERSRDGHFGFQ